MPFIQLISFGHKYGIPSEYRNIVCFDIRKLPHPQNLSKRLGEYTGKDAELFITFFKQDQVIVEYKRILEQIKEHISRSLKESHTFLIGCNSGRHRSVAFVERLFREEWKTHTPLLKHHHLIHKNCKFLKNERTKQRDSKQQSLSFSE